MSLIRDCGWPAFAVIGVALVALVVGLVALVLGFVKPRWGLLAGVLALLASCSVPGTGVFGTWRGHQMVEGAISGESITPDQRERIRTEGYREAATCTTFGAMAGVLPLVLAFAALGVGFARRKA